MRLTQERLGLGAARVLENGIFFRNFMMLAVSFAGRLGSGKTTLSKSLARSLGWRRTSFGDYVRQATRERGLEQSRQNLQGIGTQLLKDSPQAFCTAVLLSCGWEPGDNLIIDGLRHMSTVQIIRELVRPALLKIVFISVPDATRFNRLEKRGELEIASAERHSSEQELSSLEAHADLVIDGNRPVKTVIAELTHWIRNQQRYR